MKRPAAIRLTALGALWRGLALALLLCTAAVAWPDGLALEDGGRFEVRSAFLEPAEHVYQLNATIELALSRNTQQAIRDGVPVAIELDITVARKRRYLPDQEVASLTQRWSIQYHALSERYLVNNLNSGQQLSFASLASALEALSQVRGLPVIDESLIEHGQAYEASLKAVAAIEGGLPNALKAMMFWIDWKHSTEWYTWAVKP
jgi:hypothetical protein